MSQENKNKLTPEEAATFQQYEDVTQKAHEGLTEDNNKRIKLVLTKRLFICAGIPILFFTGILGVLLGASLANGQNDKEQNALVIENKELKVKYSALGRAYESAKSDIIALHQAADMESEKNAAYYTHMIDRAEGLTDHVLNLNDQLEDKDKQILKEKALTERYQIRNQTKKQFIQMALAIADNNSHQLKLAVGDMVMHEMKFYPLAAKLAVGLGSMSILEYMQSLDGWDSTIPKELADNVKSPQTVPLKKFEQVNAEKIQMAGRISDYEKAMASRDATIASLKKRVYDVKYLPFTGQQIMHYSAYHTVAENIRPKNLRQWIGIATPEEWVGYLQMAVARNSYNVYEAIMELEEVTSLPAVQKLIKSSDVLAAIYNEMR